jgi:chromosome segregation ATPase
MEDNIIRRLLLLERNVLNLLKNEDDRKQIAREIRNIVEIGRTLQGEIDVYQSRVNDNENYVSKVRELKNKIRLLKAENMQLKKRNLPEEEIINIIHDIQTDNSKTFKELSVFVEEKNSKINQLEQTTIKSEILEEKNARINDLEQTNIRFKAENDRLKSELAVKKVKKITTYKTKTGYNKKIAELERDLKEAERKFPLKIPNKKTGINETLDKIEDGKIEKKVDEMLQSFKPNHDRYVGLMEIKNMLDKIKILKETRDATFQ